MIWYSVAAALWELIHLFEIMGRLSFLGAGLSIWHQFLGPLVMAVLFLACTIEFLLAGPLYRGWVVGGVVWLGLVLLAALLGLNLEPGTSSWLFWLIILGWLMMIVVTEGICLAGYRKMRSKGQRERIIYWMLGVLVISLGDVFLFIGLGIAGSLVHLFGVAACGYVLFIHSMVDLQWALRRAAAFAMEALIGFAVYSLVLVITFTDFAIGPFSAPVVNAMAKAVFLALVMIPLLSILQDYLKRSLLGMGFDQGALVRSYSAKINSLVHLPRLVQTALEQIADIFKLQSLGLFLADKLENDHVYLLTPVRTGAARSSKAKSSGRLKIESPVMRTLVNERQSLLQYDIDIHPKFKDLIESERAWWAEQQAEVYVPIFTQENLVGVFVLGPKISGERFLPQDLDLLGLLADQTANALVNARLFDRANQLNTELKQAQESILSSNQKLRELDEMKSAFIGVLTHEMRTPLANIQFAAQVLHLYLKNNLNEEQRMQFDELDSAVKTARALIDNLVNFAAFLNQQVELKLEELDFRELLRESLQPLKAQVEQKGLRIHLNLVADRFQFLGDRRLIKDAVYQLASNAVKFTPKGDIRITCWTTKQALCFDIEDTGVGIAEDKVIQVWDAFTQASADSLKRGVEGLGLGLALVKFIVTAHGGNVWVESTPDAGSTFGFQLPLAGPDSPLPPGINSRPQRLQIPHG